MLCMCDNVLVKDRQDLTPRPQAVSLNHTVSCTIPGHSQVSVQRQKTILDWSSTVGHHQGNRTRMEENECSSILED